jgi:hypothetical protein
MNEFLGILSLWSQACANEAGERKKPLSLTESAESAEGKGAFYVLEDLINWLCIFILSL